MSRIGRSAATLGPSQRHVPAGIFGKTTIGAKTASLAENRKRVQRYELPVKAEVTKLTIWLQASGTVGEQKIKGLVYSDVSTLPSALLGTTPEQSFTNAMTAGWYDFVFAAPLSLEAGFYWIGFMTSPVDRIITSLWDEVIHSRALNTNVYTSGPSNPFGEATFTAEEGSWYGTYTTTSVTSVPTNTSLPSISGVAEEGHTLTGVNGVWTNTPTSRTHQWLRCDSAGANPVAIAGQTGQTYVLGSTDVGKTIRFEEVTKNSIGTSAPATSAATAVVTKPPVAVNTAPPTISGNPREGETLTCVKGTWTNNPTSFAHQWIRALIGGGSPTSITGATGQTYVPVSADVGKEVKVQETATNAGGTSAPATSAGVTVLAKAEASSGATGTLPGIHLNFKNGQEQFTLAKQAGVRFVRPGTGGYTLSESLKFAAAEGLKVSFILQPSAGTFNLKGLIEQWEKLGTSEQAALLCVELGNENWGSGTNYGGGAGEFIAGEKLANEFIAAAGVQESKKWPVAICLQSRMIPEHGCIYQEEQAKASHANLIKAFEPKTWLPQGNWICAHPYLGPMLAEQESATSFTNVKDTGSPFTTSGAGKWGGQRWIKEQYFWYRELGIVVPCIITEYGVEDNGSEGQNVENVTQVANTMKWAFEHCAKLRKGEYPSKRPSLAYAPQLIGLTWYDQVSFEGAGQGRFGIYFGGNKPRTEGNIFETFKNSAENLSATPIKATAKIMILMEENRNRGQVIGAAGFTFVNKMATEYGNTTNWDGVSHPSEPNYFAIISGSTQGVTDDLEHNFVGVPNLAAQLTEAGIRWKGYMENIPSPGSTTFEAYPYVRKHNPFVSFNNANGPNVVSGTQFSTDLAAGTLPPFFFYTPNMVNDGHDGSNEQCDNSAKSIITAIQGSNWYKEGGIIILTWDEDEGEGKIATIVISEKSKGKAAFTSAGNHYNILATIEDLYGLPRLGNAVGASTAIKTLFE